PRVKVKRSRPDNAAARAASRPRGQSQPLIGPGLKRDHRRHVGFWRVVFQIMIQKRAKNISPEIESCVAVEFDRAKRAAIFYFLSVMPRTKHHKDFVARSVLWLDRLVDSDVSVDVFLIPQAVNKHHWDFQGLCRQDFVHRLILPERVVIRVLENLSPEADLLEPAP